MLFFSSISTSLYATAVPLETKITGLYVAFFNRAGDLGGLDWWKAKGEEAQSNGEDVSAVLKQLSAGFSLHPTFISTYGNLYNRPFVEAIYRNALGRDGDEEGIAYWTGRLNLPESDNNYLNRSDMVSIFVETSLTSDLTPENFPTLTAEELAAAQLRKDLITNKVEVALAFTHQLGELSNVTNVDSPESDPAYLASIEIISWITDDRATVDAMLNFLTSIIGSNDPIGDILAINRQGSGTLPLTGGFVFAGDVMVSMPEGGALRNIDISVSEIPLPDQLPTGFRVIDEAFDISISNEDQDIMNAPLQVKVRYDDADISDEDNILILHYNEETGKYEPVRIISQDTVINTLVFDSRTFSSFVLVMIDAIIPTTYDTGFRAGTNGWKINNFGSYFSPGGNCLGMSGYATWYANNRTDNLHPKYTEQIATLVATRAHLAQSQTWGLTEWRNEQKLKAPYIGRLIKAYMSLLDQPLIFLAGVDGHGKHAMVVYKYDAEKLYFYDVNVRDAEQTVTYDGAAFGTYSGYNSFGYVALASLGRTEDFADLTTEAVGGFVSSQDITLTSPEENEEITEHKTALTGSLSGSLNDAIKLYTTVKGIGREISVNGGQFNQEIEISNGTNTIVLLAGVDMQQQSNWAKNGATLIRNVEGVFEASRMLVTLTWGQDNTDIDLYITEPQGETMWYSNQSTSDGLNLDFDNTSGYGPEHGTLTEGASTVGAVQDGTYKVRVHYYSDHRTGSVPITGHVNIVLNVGEDNQVEKTIPFGISVDNSSNDSPGDSGADWIDIATVDINNNVIN